MTLGHADGPHLPGDAGWRTLRAGLAPMAARGGVRDLVRALGGDAGAVADEGDAPPVTLWRLRSEATLLHEGDAAQSVWVLRSGSLKCTRTLEDGYEQVLSFAQPGELLGFEALYSGHQPSDVVALEDSTAYALPAHALRAMRQQCAALDQALQLALSRQLLRSADTAEMMAAVAADVRLARFLLLMSTRMAQAGRSPCRLLLRMGRRDIASLLGIAHETVSRSFTWLADAGLIKVANREVEITDIEQLRRHARSTRRPADEPARIDRQAAARPAAALLPATRPSASAPASTLLAAA